MPFARIVRREREREREKPTFVMRLLSSEQYNIGCNYGK